VPTDAFHMQTTQIVEGVHQIYWGLLVNGSWLRVNGERDRDAIEYDALCISKR
jgi:hypothetical protein